MTTAEHKRLEWTITKGVGWGLFLFAMIPGGVIAIAYGIAWLLAKK